MERVLSYSTADRKVTDFKNRDRHKYSLCCNAELSGILRFFLTFHSNQEQKMWEDGIKSFAVLANVASKRGELKWKY